MTFRDLVLRLRALIQPNQVERDLGDELAFHLEQETRKLEAQGLSPAEARSRARARFGSVALAADRCRDERRTAFVDDGVRDLLYAFRTFRRTPLASVTIVTTVALGLGLVAVVFTFFNLFMFRVDAVRDPGELFAVVRPRTQGGERLRFTRPQYEALRRETSVFSDAVALLEDIDSRIDGRMMAGTLVTGNFFEMLGVRAALGRALTPADDERYAPRQVVVLSHRGWVRLFGSDPAIVGRSLLVNGFTYQIVGVMPHDFRGLSVGAPDYWAPMSLAGQVRRIHAGREDTLGIDVIGRLKPGVSRDTAVAGLAVWATQGADPRSVESRTPAFTLEPRQGTVSGSTTEVLLVFSPLFFAFGLILMIGCANVANLLLARAVARQREIGIRLSLGASRRRIIRQLLTESLMLAVASAALGFVISRVVLETALYAVSSTMPPEVAEHVRLAAPPADWRMLVFLAGGAVASTMLFGLMPARQATRLELVRTIRGEVTRDARPGRARNTLIAVQVSASALLLISAAIFLRSALASAAVDPGMRTSDTVIIDIVNEPLRTAMLQAVSSHPSVAAVSASSPDALSRPREGFATAMAPAGSAGTPSARWHVAYRSVSPEFLDVLDIAVVRGRGFTPAERSPNAAVVMLSESVSRQLWPSGDAVGQTLQLEADPNSETRRVDEPPMPPRTFTVVGIFRDVAGFRLAGTAEPGVYLPTGPEVADTSLTVRVHGDPDQARQALLDRLVTVDPNMGQVLTMRTLAKMEGYLLGIAFWLTLVLGGLALALTLSGLFSVLSYLVEQRTREIGVRMALGATARSVARLVVAQSIRPVALGLLIGGGLAGSLAIALMATPAAAKIGTIVHVLDPIAYAGSIVCIVTACLLAALIPAVRAARIDPIATLRHD